jgi:hypothetical protein
MSEKCCQNKKDCCKNQPQQQNLNDYMKLGFSFWLTLVFVGLKLFGAIEWSWLWVLSPLWIGYGFIFVLIMSYVFLSALTRQTARLKFKITKKQKEKAED